MGKVFFVLGFLLLILVAQVVVAQNGIPQGIDNDGKKILNQTSRLRNVVEGGKWEYLSGKWKEFFLKNKYIASGDAFLKKFDFVFVIFLARSYDFSLELFFTFLLWVVTFIFLSKYFVFLKEEWMSWAAALVIDTLLSHTQIFNKVSSVLFRMLFFKTEWYWSMLSFVLLFFVFIIYVKINKFFVMHFNLEIERKKKKSSELAMEKVEMVAKKLTKG